MPYVEKEEAERTNAYNNRWAVSADETGPSSHLLNVLSGVVISRTEGLTRTTLRIRVGEQTDLRVRRQTPLPTRDIIEIGQRVRITIPANAVQLEAGGFRRGKQRWNRWIGRVVLVNRNNHDPVTTAKIHRDSIALHSVGPVIGADFLTTWDTVNIVVDPHEVGVAPLSRPCQQMRSSFSSSTLVDSQPSSVWLGAIIRSIRAIPTGLLVSLNVDGVRLSTVIETSRTAMSPWMAGTPVEININRCDVWIRRCAESHRVLGSVVFFREIGIPPYSVPVQRADS